MNKPVKLPEIKKDAFKKARESLGLSLQDLAQMSCYSVRQIEQIESGESSSFYGAQVKVTAAKKVAGLLKLSEENAFDFSEVVPTKKVETPKSDAPEVEKRVDTAPPELKSVSEKETEPTRSTPKKSAPAQKQKSLKLEALSSASVKAGNPQKKLMLILGIAAALVFSVINLRPLFFPEPVKEEIVVVEEVTPPPSDAASDSKADPKATPANPEPALAAAPAAVVSPAVSSECPPMDSAAVAYKPDAPKKAGDMVYLQSKTAQTVCVIDAAGKTQNKMLEPGVGASVYGKPPFKVLTTGQAAVDMFYQGAKVRLSNTTAKTILLEPAEIVQPVTSTDSQFR